MSSRTSNDKPRTKGRNTAELHGETNMRKARAGLVDPSVPPSQEAIRAAITAQMCPWCDKGPFKMLPVHTNKAHGVDKWELREYAGYSTSDPLSSEEVRATLRAAYHRNPGRSEEFAARGRASAAAKRAAGIPRVQRMTKAGLAKNTATIARYNAETPAEVRAGNARKAAAVTDRSKHRAAMKRAWDVRTPESKAALRNAAQAPEAIAKRAAALRKPPPPHGNLNRYKHHRCRCELCRAAKARDRREAKARRAAVEGAGQLVIDG